jgi:hypothetical protein
MSWRESEKSNYDVTLYLSHQKISTKSKRKGIYYAFFMVQETTEDESLFIIEALRSHSDTPHSAGRLRTSDQPVADTSTRQHTTLQRERNPCPWRDSNPQPQQASGCSPTHWIARSLGSAISHDTNSNSFNTNIGNTNSVSTCPCI